MLAGTRRTKDETSGGKLRRSSSSSTGMRSLGLRRSGETSAAARVASTTARAPVACAVRARRSGTERPSTSRLAAKRMNAAPDASGASMIKSQPSLVVTVVASLRLFGC